MKLPNGDRAIISDVKLLGYILSPTHSEGAKHARLFKALLGIDQSNSGQLRDALLNAARDEEAIVGQDSSFGNKFEVYFRMTGPRGEYIVLSVWMIKHGEEDPALITAYIRK